MKRPAVMQITAGPRNHHPFLEPELSCYDEQHDLGRSCIYGLNPGVTEHTCNGYSSMYPYPPWNWTHCATTRLSISQIQYLAMEAFLTSFLPSR